MTARLSLRQIAGLWPGAALCAVIALAATFVAQMSGGPQMLYALLFGLAFHHLGSEARTCAGVECCARTLLRLGVGLLGVQITMAQIASLGPFAWCVVAAAIAATLACGVLLAPRLGLNRAQGMLSGGAVAICGASAALAISAVLPREEQSGRFTLAVVLGVSVLSTVAMVLYPLLARALALPPELAGLFIGATIHDVAQVVGAGYTLGVQAGDSAIVVKLMRVALLAAVVVAAGVAFRAARARDGDAAGARPPLVPAFLWLFVATMALNSADLLPAPLQAALGSASRACLVVAIVALGMKTSFHQLAQAGWRPLALILVETLWLAVLVLAAIAWKR